MTDAAVAGPPLRGLRVVDLTDGLGESSTRLLADLGADVLRVESPGGSSSRRAEPVHAGRSIPFALRNANKRSVVIDLDDPSGRIEFRDLVRECDILVESGPPGGLEARDLAGASLIEENPRLVVVSISGFGQGGPRSDWQYSESVIYALSGVLSRSGEPGREPLLPPAGLVEESLGVHAAWSALLAYRQARRTGAGQVVDISALEAIVHGFDPGFGVQGSAAAGRKDDFPRGRPAAADFYPVFDCADGQVRLCLLAKRQWRAMFAWLGEPEEFADPAYDTIPARFAAADRLHPLIGALFAGHTRDELVAQGTARGIPIGGLLTPAEVLEAPHFEEAGTFVDADIAPGLRARIPNGYVSFDGARAGFRHRAPEIGEHGGDDASQRWEPAARARGPRAAPTPVASPGDRPFAGLRVLDLGVVVFGAELGRQFADHGADVIKVENTSFPDGLRQAKKPSILAASVAWGHRNRRSIGIDLRSEEGREHFLRLAAQADVVAANFKPGTLAAMGLSYDELAQVNPRIIVAEGSAFGSIGRWNGRLGYGPLVRAAAGVSALWRYGGEAGGVVCDGSTVYPDHIGGQVGAVAILARLIAREDSDRGGHSNRGGAIEIAQADTAIMQIGVQLTAAGLAASDGGEPIVATGNTDPHAAPAGVFACAGDDEWAVVTVDTDERWRRLCGVIGRDDLADDPRFATGALRIEHRSDADKAVAEWFSGREPAAAAELLQAAGVPAAPMLRLPDLLTDGHLVARQTYATLEHPRLRRALPTALRVAHFQTIPDAGLAPAPMPGEQTREIVAELLGLDDAAIEAAVAAGVLQPFVDAD